MSKLKKILVEKLNAITLPSWYAVNINEKKKNNFSVYQIILELQSGENFDEFCSAVTKKYFQRRSPRIVTHN